jgi:S1-C subfamily serine protease
MNTSGTIARMPLPGVAVLLLVALLAGYTAARVLPGGVSMPPMSPSAAPPAAPAREVVPKPEAAPAPSDLTADETRNIEIFRRASKAVVNITNVGLQRDFWSLDVFEIQQGTGSGFIWDTQGHIVTNFHVIEGGRRFLVTLPDQTEHEADVVGYAADKDLAVLHVDAPARDLFPLPIGRSADLAVGQTVLAVGNPFGLDHSLTVGVVSALGRELGSPNGRTIRDVIQTDAAINPGNSGGPLLDSKGRLIGVTSAIYSPSGAFAGIGFAVPVDTVKRLVPQLIEHGKPIQAGIGASLIPDSRARQFGLDGAVISQVGQGTPAEKAGLEGVRRGRNGRWVLGDTIVAVDGKEVRNGDDLLHLFENAGVGGRVTLTVQRDKDRRTVPITLIALE